MKKAKLITNEEADRILSHMTNQQDKLIFRISIETGLRISDILNLRAWYLERIMYVCEKKTGKIRIVELSAELMEELQPIKDCAVRNYDKERYAFLSTREGLNGAQRHLHRTTYHRRLKRAAKHAQIECSAHSGRKLYAGNIFNGTKSLPEVQKALNHKYVTTTATYLGIDLEKLILDYLEVENQ
jgi:integrase